MILAYTYTHICFHTHALSLSLSLSLSLTYTHTHTHTHTCAHAHTLSSSLSHWSFCSNWQKWKKKLIWHKKYCGMALDFHTGATFQAARLTGCVTSIRMVQGSPGCPQNQLHAMKCVGSCLMKMSSWRNSWWPQRATGPTRTPRVNAALLFCLRKVCFQQGCLLFFWDRYLSFWHLQF